MYINLIFRIVMRSQKRDYRENSAIYADFWT